MTDIISRLRERGTELDEIAAAEIERCREQLGNAAAADVLERIAQENHSDPATDDLTVPLAIELANVKSQLGNYRASAEFVKWAMRDVWNGGDLDGASVQDKAEELGLIVATKYDPERHGENPFDVEPGADWFELAPDIKAASDQVTK